LRIGSELAADHGELERVLPDLWGLQLRGAYDAICLFQTLEHMSDPHRRMADLTALLRPLGDLFTPSPMGRQSAPRKNSLASRTYLPTTSVGGRGRRSSGCSVHTARLVSCELDPESAKDEVARFAHYAMLVSRWRRNSPTALGARHASGRLRVRAEQILILYHARRIAQTLPPIRRLRISGSTHVSMRKEGKARTGEHPS
jgi:hypothetical protein